MTVKNDLISSGLSEAQALAVVAVDAGTGTAATLVQAGFSSVEAAAIVAKNAGTGSDGSMAAAGLWSGTQVPAVDAALAVTA